MVYLISKNKITKAQGRETYAGILSKLVELETKFDLQLNFFHSVNKKNKNYSYK